MFFDNWSSNDYNAIGCIFIIVCIILVIYAGVKENFSIIPYNTKKCIYGTCAMSQSNNEVIDLTGSYQ